MTLYIRSETYEKENVWGLAIFIILLGIVAFFFIKSEMKFKAYVKETASELERYKEPLETQEGHFHADGTFHHGPHEEDTSGVDLPKETPPKIKPVEVPKEETHEVPKVAPKKVYTGPLTFHAELLKTNPVKALRLQTEERGHWSAKWIPPFPPDDTEAQEFARVIYLEVYYIQTYGFEKLGTPEYEEETKEYRNAREISMQMFRTIRSYPYGARKMDLMKLIWTYNDTPVSYPGISPSEYFGDAKTREQLKQLGMWDY